METLRKAIDGEIDPKECVEAIAESFDIFCTNNELLKLPIELLIAILSHPKIKFANENDTTNFFVQLMGRGTDFAQCFSDFIPFDELGLTNLFMILKKLQSMKLENEAQRFAKIIRLKAKLDKLDTEREKTLNELTTVAQNIQALNYKISEAEIDLKGTSTVMDIMNDDFIKKRTKIKELEEKYFVLQEKLIHSK